MAPFNKRQIGYIQAVAGRQQHTSLVCGQLDRVLRSEYDALLRFRDGDTTSTHTAQHCKAPAVRLASGGSVLNPSTEAGSKQLFLQNYQLDHYTLGFDSRDKHNDDRLEMQDFSALSESYMGFGNTCELGCFHVPVAENVEGIAPQIDGVTAFDVNKNVVSSLLRLTSDGYLHSTDVKFRFTMPTSVVTSQVMAGNNPGTGANLFPTADQLGITNTNPALGITVDQYKAFLNGHPNQSVQSTNYPDDGDHVSQALSDNNIIQSMINQYNATHPMGQDHYEFRWIVWRAKDSTLPWSAHFGDTDDTALATNMDAIRDGVSMRNPGYDLFVGQTGRKRGLVGYTMNPNLDKWQDPDAQYTERYSGPRKGGSNDTWLTGAAAGEFNSMAPPGEELLTVDDLLTMRLNRDDYVIMKDVRFFLGKEHGKSHFEDTLHWDWKDPIDTQSAEVLSSPTLNDKNFRWNMTLIGTSGGSNPIHINECVRWTTKVTSG